jgi:tetratricopeptide (TPR) repeat protein
MPFGIKKDPTTGLGLDFDAIYDAAIRPGIEDAGMVPIRADEERAGGIIHQAMFERLMLCDFAIADLTTADANVYYELGVRHAVRPATTLAIFAKQQRLPFDVEFLRAVPYSLSADGGFGRDEAAKLRRDLAGRLAELRKLQQTAAAADSPVFQLLKDYPAPDIARLKTDVFRQHAHYAADIKKSLASARAARDGAQLRKIESRLGSLAGVEFGVLVDLFLSYRAVSDWQGMVALYEAMPAALQRTVMVREQLGFAYNRLGRRDDAERILEDVLQEVGMNSETCGLLGRVFKDRWNEAMEAGETVQAAAYLDRAIAMYRRGFEADPRDAYPGINAVTLLDLKGDAAAQELKKRLLPVVRFAVENRIAASQHDYWDYATLLELAVLDDDPDAARACLSDALAHVRERWEPETTANNLTLIRNARQKRGADVGWLDEIVAALEQDDDSTRSS